MTTKRVGMQEEFSEILFEKEEDLTSALAGAGDGAGPRGVAAEEGSGDRQTVDRF